MLQVEIYNRIAAAGFRIIRADNRRGPRIMVWRKQGQMGGWITLEKDFKSARARDRRLKYLIRLNEDMVTLNRQK